MNFETILSTTKRELIQAFAALDSWFDSHDLQQLHPSGKWNTIQLLEHIVHINRELLLLIDRSVDVKEYVRELPEGWPCGSVLEESYELDPVEDHRYREDRPENELCAELRWQLYRCLFRLKEFEQLQAGRLFRKNSPSGMIFYYIYFLVEHVKRHLELSGSIERKYEEELH
jgi:hypothetical protein